MHKVNETIQFGKYTWRILDIQGNEALIITEKIVTARKFDSEKHTWRICELREYLNSEFLQKFTAEQQNSIIEKQISNENNPWYKTFGSEPTKDKVFLLSTQEVCELPYFGNSTAGLNVKSGFSISDHNNNSRKAVDMNDKPSGWWLRSPGGNTERAAFIDTGGEVWVYGTVVTSHTNGVRPALWLKLYVNRN